MMLIDRTVELTCTRAEAWRAWTTSEGAQTFFAPEANIRLELLGPYELLFDPEAPAGDRGSEGMRVLSFLPEEMVSFEWNAPPSLPEAREGARSFVVVTFDALGGERTRVRLRHLGFERMTRGDEVFAYFGRAWTFVFGWLEHRFAKGPVDWSQPPPPPSRSFITEA